MARHRKLRASGWKQKEIAAKIGLRPSAYSNLVNKVLPAMSTAEKSRSDFSAIFKSVNNLSEITFRKEVDNYLEELSELSNQELAAKKNDHFLHKLIVDTPYDLLKKLTGEYDCFYISSFGYRIKCEPFRIYQDDSIRQLKAEKGNAQSASQYSGFAYMSNPQLLTFHLQEQHTLIPDHFIIHFSLPPLYDESINLLRGISTSMSNGYQPISRQVILKKLSSNLMAEPFHARSTRFYKKEEQYDEPILDFLSRTAGFLEFVSNPRPTYNFQDLEKSANV